MTPVKRILRVGLALALTALALWLSFRNVDWADLRDAFRRVNYLYVAAAMANSIFSVYALGWRWEILLRPQCRISLGKLFRFNMVSQTINIVAPARLGEFARAFFVSKEGGARVSFVFGTILVERLLDVFVFSVFWVVTPALMALKGPLSGHRAWLLLFILPAVFLMLFSFAPSLFLKSADLFGRLFPLNTRERILRIVRQGLEAFSSLRQKKTLIRLLLWTAGLIFSQILTNFILFKAFHLPLSFGPALVVLLAVQAGSLPPSAPGKIGVFEYSVILALAVFSIPRSDALYYSLMLHLTVFLPKIVLGLIYFSGMDFRLRFLKESQNIAGKT
jgi:uncharacterized protein (TIRG00374 family)